MHRRFHLALRAWVVWIIGAGVVIGVVIVTTLLGKKEITNSDIQLALIAGVAFWTLFALVAWGSRGVEWGWGPDPDAKPAKPELSNAQFFQAQDRELEMAGTTKGRHGM